MTTIAVAVVLRHGDVLVGRRAADAVDAAGLDEFPGGKVAAGETAAVAAARECLEESGIAVQVGPLLDRAAATAASGPLEILFFAATPLDDRAEPLVPFAWVPTAELPGLRFPAANAGVVARLLQGGS
ncbi:MAG: NUDIX domain-containing protein [Pirellulales bacterium]